MGGGIKMDREMLFRGKRLNNGEWVCGSLIQMDSEGSQSFIFPFYKYASSLTCGQIVSMFMVAVDSATVGQFTGLTDKNKIPQKVFKGDIVEYILSCEKYCGQVCYGIYEQDGSGGEYCPTLCIGFYIKCLFWTPQDWQEEDDERIYSYNRTVSLLNVEELMVIGNTHDNPELLKGESE